MVSLIYMLLSVVTIFWGYRASRDAVTRQKIRWVVFAALVSGIGGIVLWQLPTDVLGRPIISSNMLGLLVLPFPISIAIAVLRHRLFDIDVIIHRTLVYGVLTAMLALVYFASVVTLQFAVHGLAGQATQPPFVIVASTLVIAALFQPLRRRIQASIDRRFYRRKYDAARTLEAFGATLRQEMDLTELSEQLVAVGRRPCSQPRSRSGCPSPYTKEKTRLGKPIFFAPLVKNEEMRIVVAFHAQRVDMRMLASPFPLFIFPQRQAYVSFTLSISAYTCLYWCRWKLHTSAPTQAHRPNGETERR